MFVKVPTCIYRDCSTRMLKQDSALNLSVPLSYRLFLALFYNVESIQELTFALIF
jgi:hypothetical protein